MFILSAALLSPTVLTGPLRTPCSLKLRLSSLPCAPERPPLQESSPTLPWAEVCSPAPSSQQRTCKRAMHALYACPASRENTLTRCAADAFRMTYLCRCAGRAAVVDKVPLASATLFVVSMLLLHDADRHAAVGKCAASAAGCTLAANLKVHSVFTSLGRTLCFRRTAPVQADSGLCI